MPGLEVTYEIYLGLLYRAKLDNNTALHDFCETLEKSVVQTVEKGFMTKDLALCVYNTTEVPKDKYCNTLDFILKVAETLKANLKK